MTNTGNLKLQAVTLTVPKQLASNMSCKIGGTTQFVNGTSELAPKAVLTCTASHTVTTTDIEAGAVDLSVAVTAISVLAKTLIQEATLQLVPLQISRLDVAISNCQPLESPPGMVVPSLHSILSINVVSQHS